MRIMTLKQGFRRFKYSPLFATITVLLIAGVLAGCSPEASRTRGGGPGGDIGNRATEVQLHPGGPKIIYFNTPKEGEASELAGMPVE